MVKDTFQIDQLNQINVVVNITAYLTAKDKFRYFFNQTRYDFQLLK